MTSGTIRNATTKYEQTYRYISRRPSANTRGKQISTRSAGYHGPNDLRETWEDTYYTLINLATEAATDRDTMMTQINTISDLTATIANLTQQLHQATMRVNTLKIPKEPETPTNRPPKWVDEKHIRDADRYCWTHRYCAGINHNSVAWRSNNGGHQDDATRVNTKVGKQHIKLRH